MKGTWQGSGTWKTSSGGGGIDPVSIVYVIGGLAAIAALPALIAALVFAVEVLAIACGAVLVISAAGLVVWLKHRPKVIRRGERRYEAAFAAYERAELEKHARRAAIEAHAQAEAWAPHIAAIAAAVAGAQPQPQTPAWAQPPRPWTPQRAEVIRKEVEK